MIKTSIITRPYRPERIHFASFLMAALSWRGGCDPLGSLRLETSNSETRSQPAAPLGQRYLTDARTDSRSLGQRIRVQWWPLARAMVPGGSRNPAVKQATMSTRASGTFEVKLTPQASGNGSRGCWPRPDDHRDKPFHGDLDATSQ